MTWDKIVVDVIGLALIAFIVWFSWLVRAKGTKAAVTVVERGKPVRLNFVRQESASCSEMVLPPAFNKPAKLPEAQTVLVEFLPAEPGEYEFVCQMGMFRGRVIAESW